MLAKAKKIILTELKDFPEEKIDSLLHYIHFLKFERNIPNEITKKTFRDTDNGKNINTYSSLDDFFDKMDS
jgi:hypothetical protein